MRRLIDLFFCTAVYAAKTSLKYSRAVGTATVMLV